MFNRRQTVVKYHILNMQHAIFPGSPACFFMCRLNIPVFCSQLHHCVEYNNSHIARYQFKKQSIRLLFRSFSALQIKHTDTLMLAPCFHHQRNCLKMLFGKIFPGTKTLLYHFRHFLSGTRSIFQPVCRFIINGNSHPVNCQ